MENYDFGQAGLTGNESKVYLELLKAGSISANELAKRIGMDRTLSYTVLNHLIEKGLVNYVIKSNKKYFQATNPENLLNPIKEKEIKIKELIQNLNKIPLTKNASQEINIYEGKEGLRTFRNLMLKHKSICSFGATGRAYDYFYENPAIIKELEKKKFQARIITSPNYKDHPITKTKTFKIRYLNLKSEATTSIFGEYLSIHVLTQKPLVIIIKNKEISESYKNYFEILWNCSREE